MPLRWLERWLHQHLFKLGWLLTHNLQTTTVLYYTVFLPGILLNQVVYWLMAGVLNVRAERALKWPQKQEIAELKLDFVVLSKKAGQLRVALISTAPLVAGLVVILYVAVNVLHVGDAFALMRSGTLNDVTAGLVRLGSVPDFWLWVYFLFTVGNTMMPKTENLRGWRWIAGIVGGVCVVLFLLGVGDEIILQALRGPVALALNVLSGVFATLIGVNLAMVVLLGTAEAIIERVTGNSATFRDGKLIAVTRAEMLAQRRQEIERERQLATKKSSASSVAVWASVYGVPLPLPGAPGKEPITPAFSAVVPAPAAKPTLGARPSPALVEGEKSSVPPAVSAGTRPVSSPLTMGSPALPPPTRQAGTFPAVKADDSTKDDADDDGVTYEPVEDAP